MRWLSAPSISVHSDIKLGSTVDLLQRDLDRLIQRTKANWMRFKGQRSCPCVTTVPCSTTHWSRVDEKWPSGKALGNAGWCLADCDPAVCTGVQEGLVFSNSVDNRTRTMIVPLCLALLRPHLKSCVHFWGPLYKQDIEVVEWVQRRAMEMVKGLEHRSCVQWLRKFVLFSLEKRRCQDDLITLYSFPKRGWSKVEFVSSPR